MKKKQRARRAKRILGDDRGLMMLCKDVRRRWNQYGENRKAAKLFPFCAICKTNRATEVDHVEPVGPRPRDFPSLGVYCLRMFHLLCQPLCGSCHLRKTASDRIQLAGIRAAAKAAKHPRTTGEENAE